MIRAKPPVITLRPEVRVLASLLDGRRKKFSALKIETGLSDPWLSKMLKKLTGEGLVIFNGKRYTLSGQDHWLLEVIQNPIVYSHFLIEKAIRVADDISRDPDVLAVVLFGTTVRLEASPTSDLDLLIVTKKEKKKLEYELIDLEVKHNVPIEAMVISLNQFKQSLKLESNLSFGLLARYAVLFDSKGKVTKLLEEKCKR